MENKPFGLDNTPPGGERFKRLLLPVVPSDGRDTGLSPDRNEFRLPPAWIDVLKHLVEEAEWTRLDGRLFLFEVVIFQPEAWIRQGLSDRALRPLKRATLHLYLPLGVGFEPALLTALREAVSS